MNQSWNQYLSAVSLKTVDDAQNLPALFLCPLIDKGLMSLEGEQSQEYLQGQLTCDMQKLSSSEFLTGAHCDAKGKMWAIMNVFTLGEQYLLSGHQAEIQASQTQLQKYGVFAKTTITDAAQQWLTFGLGGKDAAAWLQSEWQLNTDSDASAWNIPVGKILKLGEQRFLLVVNQQQVESLLAQHSAILFEQDLWSIVDIQAGMSHLDESSINQYVPQMLNLHCLDAISFEKGCYAGQEMVARMKYLGKNKRATFILTGVASQMPSEGQELQLAIGDNWRRSGALITVAGNADKLYALAVLPNDTAYDARLRIKDDADSALTLSPLPYSLDAE